MININDIAIPEKVVTFEMKGCPGFKVDLCFLSKEESKKMVEKHTRVEFGRGGRQTSKLDEDAFQEEFLDKVIRNWEGLTLRHLRKLMLIQDVPDESLDEEIPFTKENVKALTKESQTFDSWVSEMVSNVENFTTKRSQTSEKPSTSTSKTPRAKVET